MGGPQQVPGEGWEDLWGCRAVNHTMVSTMVTYVHTLPLCSSQVKFKAKEVPKAIHGETFKRMQV